MIYLNRRALSAVFLLFLVLFFCPVVRAIELSAPNQIRLGSFNIEKLGKDNNYQAKIGVHTFAGGNDRAVNLKYTIIERAENHKPFELVSHSARMGIAQDPRFHFEFFKLLKG